MKNITDFIKNNDVDLVLSKTKQDYCNNMISIFERQFNNFLLNEANFQTGVKVLHWITTNNQLHKGTWTDTCDRILDKTNLIEKQNIFYIKLCTKLDVNKHYPLFTYKLSGWNEGWKLFTENIFNELPPKSKNKYLKYSMLTVQDKTLLKNYEKRIENILNSEKLSWIKQLCILSDEELLGVFKYFKERNFKFTTAHILNFAGEVYVDTMTYLISDLNSSERNVLKIELERDKYTIVRPLLSAILLNLELNEGLKKNNIKSKKVKI